MKTLQLLKADLCAAGNDDNDDNRYAHTFWLSLRGSPTKSGPLKLAQINVSFYTFYIKSVWYVIDKSDFLSGK